MTPGHNTISAGHLRAVVERIERLEEEKAAVAESIREVYAEAKGNGFDVKTIRRIVALRKKDAAERQEEQAMLELYMGALGMLADTPLGEAALRSAGISRATVSVRDPVTGEEVTAPLDDFVAAGERLIAEAPKRKRRRA